MPAQPCQRGASADAAPLHSSLPAGGSGSGGRGSPRHFRCWRQAGCSRPRPCQGPAAVRRPARARAAVRAGAHPHRPHLPGRARRLDMDRVPGGPARALGRRRRPPEERGVGAQGIRGRVHDDHGRRVRPHPGTARGAAGLRGAGGVRRPRRLVPRGGREDLPVPFVSAGGRQGRPLPGNHVQEDGARLQGGRRSRRATVPGRCRGCRPGRLRLRALNRRNRNGHDTPGAPLRGHGGKKTGRHRLLPRAAVSRGVPEGDRLHRRRAAVPRGLCPARGRRPQPRPPDLGALGKRQVLGLPGHSASFRAARSTSRPRGQAGWRRCG